MIMMIYIEKELSVCLSQKSWTVDDGGDDNDDNNMIILKMMMMMLKSTCKRMRGHCHEEVS